MNFTHPVHKEMIVEMLNHKVDFLLIGGYAVIYHGYVRTTGDMDVWLSPSNENKERLLSVFRNMQFSEDGIKAIEAMDFTSVVVFHIGADPERIDFLNQVKGLNFDEAFKRKEFLRIKELAVPVLHLDDLVISKLLSGRLKDRADVEELQKMRRPKENNDD